MRNILLKIFPGLFLLFFSLTSTSQDSLKFNQDRISAMEYDSLEIAALIEKAVTEQAKGDFVAVDSIFTVLKDKATQSNTNQAFTDVYHTISSLNMKMGRYDEALLYADELLNSAKAGSFPKRISQAYRIKGLINRELGNFVEALEFHYKAAEVNKEYGFLMEEALGINSAGMLALDLTMYDKSLSDFKQVGALAEKMEDGWDRQRAKWLSLYGIAKVYMTTNRYTESISVYSRLINEMKSKNENRMRYTFIQSHTRSAKCHLAIGHVDQAEILIKSVFKELESFKYKSIEAEAQNILSEIYIKQGNYGLAAGSANTALQLATGVGHKELIKQSSERLASIYQYQGQFEKALIATQNASIYKDSLFAEDRIKEFAKMESEFNLKQKQQEIINLEQQNQIQTLWLSFGAIGIAILSFLVILFWRISILRKRANTKILSQNEIIKRASKEKDFLIQEVHHRTKNNLAIVESLLSNQEVVFSKEEARNTLEDSRNRVKAISLVHQLLYQSDTMDDRIIIPTYLDKLISYLKALGQMDDLNIKTDYYNADISLSADQAIPFCLIANELITNCLKHAFIRKGNIRIKLGYTDQNKVFFMVSDDGIGASNIDSIEGFGLKLVRGLAKQLKAKLSFINNNGLEAKLIFEQFKDTGIIRSIESVEVAS